MQWKKQHHCRNKSLNGVYICLPVVVVVALFLLLGLWSALLFRYIILWHTDTLLGDDRRINNYTAAVAADTVVPTSGIWYSSTGTLNVTIAVMSQQRGTVLSAQSVQDESIVNQWSGVEWVSLSRVVVSESRKQVRNPEEEELLPL